MLRQLLLQRRQGLFGLRERGFLRGNFHFGYDAGAQLIAEHMEHIGFNLDELIGGGNLAAQRGFLNGRDHDVRRQGEIGRLELEALVVALRLQRFHRRRVPPNTSGV